MAHGQLGGRTAAEFGALHAEEQAAALEAAAAEDAPFRVFRVWCKDDGVRLVMEARLPGERASALGKRARPATS